MPSCGTVPNAKEVRPGHLQPQLSLIPPPHRIRQGDWGQSSWPPRPIIPSVDVNITVQHDDLHELLDILVLRLSTEDHWS